MQLFGILRELYMVNFLLFILKKTALIVPLAILTCYSAYCLVFADIFTRNTLVNDSEWFSTKEELGVKGVSGAYAFMRRTQALAGGQLNLDVWHGFQEVTTRDKTRVRNAEFDFLLDSDAYFCFEFKLPEHFSGIRISLNPAVKSIYFEANDDGEFTAQHEIVPPVIEANRWNHFALVRTAAGGADVRINGQRVPVGAMRIPECCSPAFRGGQRHAAIDNVVFRTPNLTVLVDDFVYKEHLRQHLFYVFVILLVIDVAYYYSQNIRKNVSLPIYKSLLIFNVFIAVVATFILGVVYRTAGWYPSDLGCGPSPYLCNLWDWRRDEVFQEGLSHAGAGLVLFLGTSQTYGVGARTQQETFVNVIQQRLNDATKDAPRFYCVNGGLSGNSAQGLARLYEDLWINMKPLITVVNLGVNDSRNPIDAYEASLRRIAELDRQRNIKTLFVNEARTWERTADCDGENPMNMPHTTEEVTKKLAAELGIPCVDAKAQLKANRDRGFLWWDFVHPTSFGHRLIADTIFEELKKMLDIKNPS